MKNVCTPTAMYNLVWVHPLPPPPPEAPPIMSEVALCETNTLVVIKAVPAVVLFPSLMTPCVFRAPRDDVSSPDPWLELLLATSEPKLKAEHVNQQLKIYAGLAVEKKYHPEPLFAGTGGNIEVEPAAIDAMDLVRTHKRFSGVIHKSVLDRLKKAGLDKLYRVRVHHHALHNAPDATTPLRPKGQSDEQKLKWRAEKHDELIKDMLETRHQSQGEDAKTLPGLGTYAFNLSKEGVHLWNQEAKAKTTEHPAEERCRAVNWEEPIQAYHPVFFYESGYGPEYLNYGHLTDIHVNSRVNLLQRSPAQVIPERGEFTGSPRIDELIEPTNRAFSRLLAEMADDAEAHVLLLGGDLIDHQMNAFSKTPPERELQAVWDAVSLDNQKGGYVRGVDMVAFYTMLVDFCRKSSKPVFGVSGNHDCYLAPFGISPRALGFRANAGIPADLNLTLYEAILAFGPTFDDFKLPRRVGHAPSSFDAEWMEWFYTVFTPFTDFRAQLPRQQLVCLGWGNEEDMMLGGDQGGTHLPRADESVSAVQLKLARDAARRYVERPVTVLTHFTVASYREEVPMLTQGRPTSGRLENETNEYTMGTFESGRDAFIKLLSERTICCVISGHSHRRGLYFCGIQGDGVLGDSFPTLTMHEPSGFDIRSVPEHKRRPAIIVSDSAGPYPRHNQSGEFHGWGSDKPGGSVVKFDERGELSSVKVVQSADQASPRLAVSIDYFDIDVEPVWKDGDIQTAPFMMDDEANMLRGKLLDDGSFYRLHFALSKRLPPDLRVASLSFHDAGGPALLTLSFSGRHDGCRLFGEDNLKFYQWCQRSADPDRFVSVSFAWDHALAVQYKVERPWNYEAQLAARSRGGSKWYVVTRPSRWAGGVPYRDIPDFAWRAKRQNSDGSGSGATALPPP